MILNDIFLRILVWEGHSLINFYKRGNLEEISLEKPATEGLTLLKVIKI